MKSAVTSNVPGASAHVARDLDGRRFIITGPYSGIGRVTAANLASRGAAVVLAGRSLERCQALAAELRGPSDGDRIEVLALDLADLASVRAAAEQLIARGGRIDGLINNAGVAGARGRTRDGFELAFGVNHLGHFLFTRLLEARLRESAPARVINVSSEAHRRISSIDFAAFREPTKTRTALREYGVSKLCNILFTREVARRWAGSGITAYALHPGVIATDIWRSVPQPLRWLLTRWMKTPEAGAATSIRCATDPALANVNGRYFINEREVNPNRAARDDGLAARLWEESEAMI
jgi:NAD(P)-dependent dehydrogenase (short-subunit alcohol dehydrogenase family)